mgnify:CR=1 FL=1
MGLKIFSLASLAQWGLSGPSKVFLAGRSEPGCRILLKGAPRYAQGQIVRILNEGTKGGGETYRLPVIGDRADLGERSSYNVSNGT